MAMSDFERGCRAVDLLMAEVTPLLAVGDLKAARDRVRAGLTDEVLGAERQVRQLALELLQAGLMRDRRGQRPPCQV